MSYDALTARLVADVEDYAILLLDLAGNVMTWNVGAQRLKGYRSDEIIGRHFSVFYPPEDVAAGKPARELEIAAAEGRVEDEGWRLRQDGSAFWASVVITALRDPDGTARGYGKVTRDLTERHSAELALRSSAERLRSMDAGVQDYAILTLDPEGVVTSWNAGAHRLEGYAAEEIIGRHFSVFYPQEDVTAGKPARELAVAAAEGYVEDDGWRVRQDGTRFWAHVVITAFFDVDGTLRGFGKITSNLGQSRRDDDFPADLARDHPDGAGIGRQATADDRDRTADDRDRTADAHDVESKARDKRSTARDRRADAREQAANVSDTGSAADRAGGSRDRRSAASDRGQAAEDREAASVDRDFAARDRAHASVDGLTNAYRREPGTLELARELMRAQRMKRRYVVAFVDLDDMKRTNDTLGHAAGDLRLQQTADLIRSHLRPYDLLVRMGGDEFAVGLSGLTTAECAARLHLANSDLTAAQQLPITFGLAESDPGDSLEDLIERADASLYSDREGRRQH